MATSQQNLPAQRSNQHNYAPANRFLHHSDRTPSKGRWHRRVSRNAIRRIGHITPEAADWAAESVYETLENCQGKGLTLPGPM